MSDETTMTMSVPDGNGGMIETGPFTPDDLKRVLGDIRKSGAIDELTALAAETLIEHQKASTSLIQRKLAIGYNRAARIIETLEAAGLVTAADHVGHREVMATEVPAFIRKASATAAAVKDPKRTPMENTPADDEVRDKAYRVTANELRQFVERIERLDAEKKDIADQRKEVLAEAKSRGYDTKVLARVLAMRKRDKDDLAEEEAVLDMYREALGM